MPSLTFHEDKDKATVALKNINISLFGGYTYFSWQFYM